MKSLFSTVLTASLSVLFIACENKNETFEVVSSTDYYPLQAGKYITYQLDSTVFTQQGRMEEIHSYQEKQVVDAAVTDAMGRPSYRIYRYLRDAAGTEPWRAAGTFIATTIQGNVEVIDNNLRIVRLVSPVKNGGTWMGNRFLPVEPYSSTYQFNNDNNIADWNFSYTGINDVFTSNGKTYKDVLTVEQIKNIDVVDTVNVLANKALIPANVTAVWLRGGATDTVRMEVPGPASGTGDLLIYNQTDFYATLNGIRIPPRLTFRFAYFKGQWTYPNTLLVANNQVSVPKGVSTAFIAGMASGPIQINTSSINPSIGRVTIYNKSNFNAFANFNATLSTFSIPPGKGRSYEYVAGNWILFGNANTLLDGDPFLNEKPYGSKNYSVEKYAKGLGMVFQELVMWEYEPNPSGTPYKTGFGVRRTIIDSN